MANRHAYLIIAHGDWYCLRALLACLDDKRNDIYLHVDAKAKDFAPSEFSTAKSRLFILENRLKVYWGHYSQIKVEMKLFEAAFRNDSYRYYHLLSGVDLPLKTQDEIHQFFRVHDGKEFIGYGSKQDYQALRRVGHYNFFMKYDRSPNYYLSVLTAKLRQLFLSLCYRLSIDRRKKDESIVKLGYNWCSVTGDFVAYMLEHKKYIFRRYRYTQCADEVYKQTLCWNSPFGHRLYNMDDPQIGSQRLIDWTRTSAKGQSSPHIFTLEDEAMLLDSSLMFARKFSSSVSKELIDKLTQHAIQRKRE